MIMDYAIKRSQNVWGYGAMDGAKMERSNPPLLYVSPRIFIFIFKERFMNASLFRRQGAPEGTGFCRTCLLSNPILKNYTIASCVTDGLNPSISNPFIPSLF